MALSLIAPLAAGITGAGSGTAEIYARGTTTPVYAYSDPDGNTVLAKIVPLDANGGAEAYAAEPVFVRVRSSLGVVVREFTLVTGDNDLDVESASFTGLLGTGSQGAGGVTDLNTVLTRWIASAGTTDFKILRTGLTTPQTLQAAFAAVTASNLPLFNVVNYGAAGDAVTVCDTAFKAAHDAAVAAGGGIIFVPGGSFILGSAFAITSPKVSMMGAGPAASVIVSGIASGVAVTYNGAAGSYCGPFIRDIKIAAFSSGANVTPLQVVSTPGIVLQNVQVTGFALAVDIRSRALVVGCDWSVPTSAVAGDYVAKFTSNAADTLILGGSFTQARATNTGAISLGVNNLAVIGALVDISALSGAGYGVDVSAANCKVYGCDFLTGVAATYAIRVNADVSFTENDNTYAGSGKQAFLATALTATTRVLRGSRTQRYTTQNSAVVNTVTATLDPDYEFNQIVATSSSGVPVIQVAYSAFANTVHQGMRLIVQIDNQSANSVAVTLSTGFTGPAITSIATTKRRIFEFLYVGTPTSGSFRLVGGAPADM